MKKILEPYTSGVTLRNNIFIHRDTLARDDAESHPGKAVSLDNTNLTDKEIVNTQIFAEKMEQKIGTIESRDGKIVEQDFSLASYHAPIPANSRVTNISVIKKSGTPIITISRVVDALDRVFIDSEEVGSLPVSVPLSEVIITATTIDFILTGGTVDIIIDFKQNILSV